MGNPDHLKELLKGVDHWNAWRREQGEDFQPDLSDYDIRKDFDEAGLLDPLGRIPLAGADLRGADLREADLREAVLRGAVLERAVLEWADLREADLVGADLREADLVGAVLERADLREADLVGADLVGADAQTVVSSGVRTNNGGTPEDTLYRTDLSATRNLTQDQLDTMFGDSETIIPDNLERPAHWPEFEPSDEVPSSESKTSKDAPSPKAATLSAPTIRASNLAITQVLASLIEQINAECERVRGDNHLSANEPENYDRTLRFYENLRGQLTGLGAAVQDVAESTPETEGEPVKQAQGFFDDLKDGLSEGLEQHIDGKRLGKASVPLGIIFGLGAVGALLTGGNPIGFGAGMLAGKYFTGEMKAGTAADKTRDMFPEKEDGG